MTGDPFEALAAPTRRHIYQLLADRPRSVGELAAQLPVSRPAVSQHLRVLVDARLARLTTVGNRNVYSVDPDGMTALRATVDEMWETAMGRFAGFVQREMEDMMETVQIEPVVKRVTVPGEPGVVFDLFTERIDEWWPKRTHSVGGDHADRVVVAPGAGGRVYEVTDDGVEHDWGEITGWEPAVRLELTWHPGLATSQSTHLEVTFRATAEGTEVTLVHDGWDARGPNGPEVRDDYDTGWDVVLAAIPGTTRVG